MMAGALGGSGTAGALGEPTRRRFCNGMFSFYVDVAAFDTDNAFAQEVKGYVDFMKSASPTRSEEHTSELQSLMRISYAVFCLNKNTHEHITHNYFTLSSSVLSSSLF